MVIARCLIICVKYGYYSEFHKRLYHEKKLNSELIGFDLVANATYEKREQDLTYRLDLICQSKKIDQEIFVFDIDKNSYNFCNKSILDQQYDKLTSKIKISDGDEIED